MLLRLPSIKGSFQNQGQKPKGRVYARVVWYDQGHMPLMPLRCTHLCCFLKIFDYIQIQTRLRFTILYSNYAHLRLKFLLQNTVFWFVNWSNHSKIYSKDERYIIDLFQYKWAYICILMNNLFKLDILNDIWSVKGSFQVLLN